MELVFAALFGVFTAFASSTSPSHLSDQEVVMYLKQYGYLDIELPTVTQGRTSESIPGVLNSIGFQNSLMEFQTFVGLEPTGKLDNATLAKMNSPRCGVRDKYHHQGSRIARTIQYSASVPWNLTLLSYRISKHSNRLMDRDAVTNEIAKAFQVWSQVTPLRFEERPYGTVNIDLRFEVGNHGDGERNAFNINGGTKLAHAQFPPRFPTCVICINDAQEWTLAGPEGRNFYQTVVHEIGHSLGLGHSEFLDAVMYPYDTGYKENHALHPDDVNGIQSLYGGTSVPDLCHGSSIDTVTSTRDGKTYFFRGAYYWESAESGDHFVKGYPRKISKDWAGLPDDLDASLYLPSDGNTYFFKGNQHWKFTNKDAITGYPKFIGDRFPNMPSSPDAVFQWKGNGLIYFLKDDKYWRFAERNKYQGPLSMSDFKQLPYYVDAATQWRNGHAYIFKCDRYYRLNNEKLEVDTDPTYPRSTAFEWFGCRE